MQKKLRFNDNETECRVYASRLRQQDICDEQAEGDDKNTKKRMLNHKAPVFNF